MEPIKGWEDFIITRQGEVSGEGSLGRLGQGFDHGINEISLVGFFPGFGVFLVKHCVYVCDLLLGSLCVFLSVNILLLLL